MRFRPILYIIAVGIVAAFAVLMFMDSVTWMSGSQRYTIYLERVFSTPESLAMMMRVIQATTAVAVAAGCVGTVTLLKRRARHY